MSEVELKDEERQPCEVWTRVMGYFRPFSEFNCGKKAEFTSRKCFVEEKAMQQINACSNKEVDLALRGSLNDAPSMA